MKSRLFSFLLLASLCAGGEDAKRPTPKAAAKPDSRLADLKLQQICSEAADKFWEWHEVQSPRPKDGDRDLHTRRYSNHYNRGMGRCLVMVNSGDLLTDPKYRIDSYEIFDAYEKIRIASLIISRKGDDPEDIELRKFGELIERTEANVDWYNGLMKR